MSYAAEEQFIEYTDNLLSIAGHAVKLTDYEAILEKAIQKAIDGGLTGYWKERYEECVKLDELKYLTEGDNIEQGMIVEKLIFSHGFAKALWGKRTEIAKTCSNDGCDYPRGHLDEGLDIEYCPFHGNKLTEEEVYVGAQPWIKHLQQMVIAKDPIRYLEENI